MDHSTVCKLFLPAVAAALFSVAAAGQTAAVLGPAFRIHAADTAASVSELPSFDVAKFHAGTFDEDAAAPAATRDTEPHRGFISRAVRRTMADQKEIYLAPFKPSNFKWDALVLAPTALLLVTDRHIENNLPGGHYQFYQDSSNIAIAGLSATLAGVWLYGIKGEHPHARETGLLELETLTDTFLVYLPMQYIAGRERPGEGNGHGDFLRHHAMNTSFPGGHAMFTWAMATVVAQEYHQPWVKALTYSAAFTVTLTRFLARDHWASDMWVGSALGIGIGTHVFHSHCDPELSEACKHHAKKHGLLRTKLENTPLGSWPNAKPAWASASGRPPSE